MKIATLCAGLLMAGCAETQPGGGRDNDNMNSSDRELVDSKPSTPASPIKNDTPDSPGEKPQKPSNKPSVPTDFHAGRGLSRSHILMLDSEEEPLLDACTAEKQEMGADYFIINNADDARSYLSEAFLEAYPEFLTPEDYGSQIVVYRYYTGRDNSRLQLNFIEELQTGLSVDVSYFTTSEEPMYRLYTQMVTVWLSTGHYAASTPVWLHVHTYLRGA